MLLLGSHCVVSGFGIKSVRFGEKGLKFFCGEYTLLRVYERVGGKLNPVP